jgi:ATP-dependent RNA helicase DDX10/DBP4
MGYPRKSGADKNSKNTTSRENKKRKNGKKNTPVYKKPEKKTHKEENEANELVLKYDKIDLKNVKTFKDLPLSGATQKALKDAGYSEPTQIQKESILLSLRGLDVLGSAKTGSGKTLAFVVPVLERLWRLKWSRLDGLGALIITPTRELAYQIFETIRKVGKNHDFSAGLVIGGKDWNFESKRLSTCNIIVCTPGRLLQHMDENPQFDASSLNLLILDEADRCLDMGFSPTMNAILENLPKRGEVEGVEGRQTLLFSATQTKSVNDLARLSLEDPIYVSVHEKSLVPTPDNLLSQCYIVCPLSEKLNILWSFLKSHRRKKVLVFMQSCKQVKYVHEIFRRLRHGASISALYGTLHQMKRMAIYDEFCKNDQAVLFATDIAARGLDFPSVDWVIQLDCPESATTYLHRVGRTARHAAVGNSFLMLLPSEETGMLQQLRAHKVPIEKIEPNPRKVISIQRKIEAYLAQDHELKESASRAYVAYLKSTYLLKNKAVFDVFALDTFSFAASLGLAIPPRARFLEKQIKLKAELRSRKNDLNNEDQKQCNTEISSPNVNKKENSAPKLSNRNSSLGLMVSDSSDDEDADILTVKRKDHDIPEVNHEDSDMDEQNELQKVHELRSNKNEQKSVTKAAVAKKVLKKGIIANQVTKFDEEGDAVENVNSQKISQEGREYDEKCNEGNASEGGINLEEAARILKAEDRYDQQIEREKVDIQYLKVILGLRYIRLNDMCLNY